MAIEISPLPLPPSADPSKFTEFGREVRGVDPGNLSPEEFAQVHDLLYKVNVGELMNFIAAKVLTGLIPAQRTLVAFRKLRCAQAGFEASHR